MRVIKFRGVNVANDEWTYGSLVIVNDDFHILDGEEDTAHDYNRVDENTVGQFTGLKDSLGKEIYDGDILSVFFTNELNDLEEIELIGKVEMTPFGTRIKCIPPNHELHRPIIEYDDSGNRYIDSCTCEPQEYWNIENEKEFKDFSFEEGGHVYKRFQILKVIGNIHDNPELNK